MSQDAGLTEAKARIERQRVVLQSSDDPTDRGELAVLLNNLGADL